MKVNVELSFERSRGRRGLLEPNKCVQGGRGVQILTFCDKIIIEWPLNIILLSIFFTCELLSEKKVSTRQSIRSEEES